MLKHIAVDFVLMHHWKVCGEIKLFSINFSLFANTYFYWAVVVVKWSACSPSTPTIRVRICWGLQFFCKIVIEKNENKQKEAGVGPFLKILTFIPNRRCLSLFIELSAANLNSERWWDQLDVKSNICSQVSTYILDYVFAYIRLRKKFPMHHPFLYYYITHRYLHT